MAANEIFWSAKEKDRLRKEFPGLEFGGISDLIDSGASQTNWEDTNQLSQFERKALAPGQILQGLKAREPWALNFLNQYPNVAEQMPLLAGVVAEINSEKRGGANMNNSLGASRTNINNVNPSLGSLGTAMGITPSQIQSYIDLAQQHIGTRQDRDPWLTAFQFFANMAAEASKPGATAIGAAGTAGAATVDTLLEERKQKRAEKLAATQMGLTLAGSLGKAGSWKVGAPRGEQAYYMEKDKATQYFIDKGLDPTSPNFNRLVESLKPPTPEFKGKPIIKHDAFVEMIPLIRNNKLYDYNISPMKDPKPRSAAWFKKRMAELAKDTKWIGTVTEVIPQAQRGLDVLLSGAAGTGILDAMTLGLRQAWGEIFGTQVPDEVVNARSLEALSNFLAPKMRPKGSGSTSNMEFDAYKKAILSIKNPELANYISLYTFIKTQQNAATAHELETKILTNGGTSDMVTKAIKRIDKGLYEKYTGDPYDEDALAEWHNNLPRGSLIFNRDTDGNKLWESNLDGTTVGLFLVKGWRQ